MFSQIEAPISNWLTSEATLYSCFIYRVISFIRLLEKLRPVFRDGNLRTLFSQRRQLVVDMTG